MHCVFFSLDDSLWEYEIAAGTQTICSAAFVLLYEKLTENLVGEKSWECEAKQFVLCRLATKLNESPVLHRGKNKASNQLSQMKGFFKTKRGASQSASNWKTRTVEQTSPNCDVTKRTEKNKAIVKAAKQSRASENTFTRGPATNCGCCCAMRPKRAGSGRSGPAVDWRLAF